jgi:hypothetical protein
MQTSLVGVKNEEIGGYFPDFLEKHLEVNHLLNLMLPWGKLSINENTSPDRSDDGPILWCRPGEQLIPTSAIKDMQPKPSDKKKRYHLILPDLFVIFLRLFCFRKEVDMLPSHAAYIGRGTNPREILFEDRTRPHADNVGSALETTAAVGLLQAIYGDQADTKLGNRIVKDVVCFHAEDYEKLVELLRLDLYEPPVAQVRMGLSIFFSSNL